MSSRRRRRSQGLSLALTTSFFLFGSAASAAVPPPVAPAAVPSTGAALFAPPVSGPALAFRSAPRSLRTARERGLRVKLSVAGAEQLKAYAILSRSAAGALEGTALEPARESGDITLARRAISRPPSDTFVVTLPFGPAAQEALIRFAQVQLRVHVVAIDAAGNRRSIDQAITLN